MADIQWITNNIKIIRNPYVNNLNVQVTDRIIMNVAHSTNYLTKDYNTYIELKVQPTGDIYLEDFFASVDPTLPKTPKGIGKQILCTLLYYLLENDKTTLQSQIELMAVGSDPGTLENRNTLIHKVYYPMGFEVIDFPDELLEEEGGAQMRANVITIMNWCSLQPKKKSRKKPSGYDWRKSKIQKFN